MPDPKALRILFSQYWSGSGWTRGPISDEDFEYARRAGVMFYDAVWGHDDTIARIRSMVAVLDPVEVGRQFVASLSTRRLDLRSALGSYAVARLMPEHSHTVWRPCPVCSMYGGLRWVDLNVLNFERHKWGGVRHLDPEYIRFDLNRFTEEEHIEPKPEDWAIFRRILGTLRTLPAGSTPRAAARALREVIRSNDSERRMLLEILGFCSVLETPQQPGFLRRFIPHAERLRFPRPGGANDWSYPVAWWRSDHGINEEALRFFFPDLGQL